MLLLGLVDFANYVLEWFRNVLLEIRTLPVVYWSSYEREAHLRPEPLGQLALLRGHLDYLVCDAVHVLL